MSKCLYIEKFWAIYGNYGLYTGTWLTRADAIKAHVNAKYIIPSPKFPNQKSAWRHCKKNGDKAIKVGITYCA